MGEDRSSHFCDINSGIKGTYSFSFWGEMGEDGLWVINNNRLYQCPAPEFAYLPALGSRIAPVLQEVPPLHVDHFPRVSGGQAPSLGVHSPEPFCSISVCVHFRQPTWLQTYVHGDDEGLGPRHTGPSFTPILCPGEKQEAKGFVSVLLPLSQLLVNA